MRVVPKSTLFSDIRTHTASDLQQHKVIGGPTLFQDVFLSCYANKERSVVWRMTYALWHVYNGELTTH